MIKRIKLKRILTFIVLCFIMLVPQYTAFAAKASLSLNYDGKTVKYTGVTYKIIIDSKEVKTDLPGLVFGKADMFPLRAVFEQLGGTVTWNNKTQVMNIAYNGYKLQFKNNDSSAAVNGKSIRLSTPAKKINDRLMVPVDFIKNIQGLSAITDSKTKTINITSTSSVKEVSCNTSGGKDIVSIKMNNPKGYEVSRMTNPNRIVVELKNVKASDKGYTIKTNSSLVTEIRVSALNTNSTRVELDLEGIDNYSVTSAADGYKITVEKPVNAQLSYVDGQDRVYFSLKGIKLASVGSTITNYFKENYDIENGRYTITIPSSSAISLADENLNIDDSLVKTVEIFRDKETSDTNIVFNVKKEFKFYTTYNETRKQTEINLLTPAKEGERLVVIDAGHGGEDPGATSGTAKEKDINLAIALKLEKLLKANNVKTFMLRQDDTFVGLYDRPYIANALNATLFLSIHNNSIDSSRTSGTETLYFPEKAGDTSFTGQKFAKSIQDLLISKIKTVNRRTVERPGLVVLKYTKMPSALAEIGFVSNPAEVKNLQSGSFQQKTAEALCEAIVKALNQIELEKNKKADSDLQQ